MSIKTKINSLKIAYTVCSVSHLGQAKAMMESFNRYNPTIYFYVGIVDTISREKIIESSSYFEIICIDDIADTAIRKLYTKFTVFEMCGIARVILATFLLEKFETIQTLIYVDTDIYFFGKIPDEYLIRSDFDILITPHILNPYKDNYYPREVELNNSGLYNSGFYLLKNTYNTKKMLDWWQLRLQEYGYVNFMDGMFVDQLWLNFVPLFFDKVLISKDLGLNCGYWNLHERHIRETENGEFKVNNEFPLVFFHFSGYNTNKPTQISAHTDRFDLTNRPELTPLFEAYHQALLKNRHSYYLTFKNQLIPEKSYKKWGRIREFALRIARKIIRMWHG